MSGTKSRPKLVLLLAPYSLYVAWKSCTFEQLVICVCIGLIFGIFFNSAFVIMIFSQFAKFIPKPKSSALRKQMLDLLVSIENYESSGKQVIDRKKRLFFMLSLQQQNRCRNTYVALNTNRELQLQNYEVLCRVKEQAERDFGIKPYELVSMNKRPNDIRLANEVLEHLVRDWQIDSKSRTELFDPVLKECQGAYKRILVPGCGLGRLAYDLAQMHPSSVVDAVELSGSMYYIAKNLQMLKPVSDSNDSSKLEIYPNVLKFSNWKSRNDQFEPSVLQVEPNPKNLNVMFKSFLDLDTSESQKYDCIATLYFIDTAQNIFQFIDKIASLLAKNGVWINCGPLQYGTAAYAELTAEELFEYLESTGWKVTKKWSGTNRYNGSPKNMVHSEYEVLGFSCVRK